MSDSIITVENLGKKYVLGHQKTERYTALRDVMAEQARNLGRRVRRPFGNGDDEADGASEEFWALKDVSFEVKQGDRVGIIGRNGAGKSTLLKILSRITEPTTGRVRIKGRVASLLEVGTGFHPELTGRENIYLNGAILGMSKAEIKRKFDEIVDFAEVEKFLDTPVKRYSSGMYVRLAFAVAAHLEPELLIVDEVLAVGDAQFQKKCLGKMQDVAGQGRTVLFVSHNMAAISNLCSTGVVLQNGKAVHYNTIDSAVQQYSSLQSNRTDINDLNTFRTAGFQPLIQSARLLDSDGKAKTNFPLGSDITIEMTFAVPDSTAVRCPVMGVVVNHLTLGTAGGVNTRMTDFTANGDCFSSATMRCTLKRLPFLQGQYTIDLWLGDGPANIDCLVGYLNFQIESSDIYGTGRIPFSNMGLVFLEPVWQLTPEV